MALCPTVTPPAANITDGLQLLTSFVINGDYVVAGCGTRTTGSGTIRLKNLPPNTTITQALLIYNTYQSNNQPVTSNITFAGDSLSVPTIEGICGSTCWVNPGPELTTYLSNRVYVVDVTANMNGNGNYSISGLPVDFAMPIIGDRLPGCNCSQGAVLFVAYKWNPGSEPKADTTRQVLVYTGAKLIAIPTAIWGGSTSYNLNFTTSPYKWSANITVAAGDAQTAITGDSLNINGIQFVPPTNAFLQIGSSLSIRNLKIANVYDGNQNSVFVKTTNDCICWFFFAISADQTVTKGNFQKVSCAATILDSMCGEADTTISVFSNMNQMTPIAGCYAVPSGPGFPPAEFYISIDSEIMKVTGKSGAAADPKMWSVTRGQAGTTAADHENKACIRLLMPVQSKGAMQAALAKKGQPNQRPNAGAWAGKGQ